MSKSSHPRILSESIQSKTKELFPNDFEKILDFFGSKLDYYFHRYKTINGFSANEKLLKILFLSVLCNEIKFENYYYLPDLPFSLKHNYFGKIIDTTEYEILPLMSPLEYIGSDGCGGKYFMDMSTQDDIFYHVWEEFSALEKMDIKLINLISLIKVGAEELYFEVKNEFRDLLNEYQDSGIVLIQKTDLDQLIPLSVGLSLTNSPYMPKTTFDYSYQYFEAYLNNEESDYFKYDDTVCSVNSQIIAAFFQLYFSGNKSALNQLVQLTYRKTKGSILNSHRDFFNALLVAETELKDRIIVNM
ncbi:MAG: hypothetical protein AB8F94_06100 [Saprospiraceae bacterium]